MKILNKLLQIKQSSFVRFGLATSIGIDKTLKFTPALLYIENDLESDSDHVESIQGIQTRVRKNFNGMF